MQVIPIEALLLLRFIISLTDEAQQAFHREDPAREFILSSADEEVVAANCLCRSLLFEANLLSSTLQPLCGRLFKRGKLVCANGQNILAIDRLRMQLETPRSESSGWLTTLVFVVAVDNALKKHFYPAGQAQSTHEQSARSKLARAYHTHLEINRKIRAIFNDKHAAKEIDDSIRMRAILGSIKEQTTEIGSMNTYDMAIAVEKEMKALGLDEWPNAAYLDF